MTREIKFKREHFTAEGLHLTTTTWGKLERGYFASPATRSDEDVSKAIDRQYTGLRDRNGVEIYEGDIVKKDVSGANGIILYFAPTYAGYIIFHPERGYIPDDWDGTYNTLDGRPGAFGDAHQLQVIGNVYENPELLEGRS